ncbi:hypothetical protein MIND_00729300 [Mycena indigotica]|uniref:Uncharacterized protein n=1 Tax=Mycena indigotica TaxID=2126181 RepID=A0A8H6W4N0_9AGAR|nr:uncharacterized protein MIND_00729300 [Mycena indigotica]KAF7301638.1 hypothetical protein MIND_00729300 [Mycena indigotica]
MPGPIKVNPLHIFRGSRPETTRVVLAAISASSKPLSSREAFDAVQKIPEQQEDNTIRSLRHLKLVLNALKDEKAVRKELVPVPLDEMSPTERLRSYREKEPRAWRWRLPEKA